MNPSQLIENRAVLTIFRDCLKVAPRMVDHPAKVKAVRLMMRQQFQRHREVVDPTQIRNLKMTAAKGISNFIIHTVKQQYDIRDPNINVLEEQESKEEKQP